MSNRVESDLGSKELINQSTSGQQTSLFHIGTGVFLLSAASVETDCTDAAPGAIIFRWSNMKGAYDEVVLVSGWFNAKNPLCLPAPKELIGPGDLYGYYEVPTTASSKFAAQWRRIL